MLIDKLNIILNSNDEFSPKYIISSFVKNNLNDIPTMSIDAIALSCHTSKSQISKYVKSLGYETMKDFKDACLDNISSMERTNKTLFSLQNSIINGNTFYFDKRVVHHILKCSVNTWLISCKDNINFSKNYLYIPTLNDKYNDYLLRHILDFILMY